MNLFGVTPTITQTFDPPTPQGTVALGYVEHPVTHERFSYRAVQWTPEQCRRANIVANSAGGHFDWSIISADFNADELAGLGLGSDALAAMNAGTAELGKLLATLDPPVVETADADELVDRAEELQEKWKVKRGDCFEIASKSVLGKFHRILCGDSTNADDVARVMDGEKAQLCDADPPYGMGKENEGIANDNLYREKLDKFQMAWWRAWRPHFEDNASAYIWGNADDLWRLWYCGGLRDSERLTFRNEIVWKKEGAQGIGSESHRQYPTASERCLVFMLGEQGFNINADNYWDGWTPVLSYMANELKKVGDLKWADIATNSQMAKHYFTKSQWLFPTREMYEKLQRAANGKAFKREFGELKREFDELKREFYSTRAFFDNTHDNMTDVWGFGRVIGDDRMGHATPKPVAMMERIVKTSAPSGGVVAVPFVGTAPDFVACEQTGRIGRGIEISEKYVAVSLERLSLLGLDCHRLAPG